MSSTSDDLPLSLAECDSSRSKRNDDSKEVEDTSKKERFKSQSFSEDRSEHYARLLKESERALSNRNVLITLLQDQLVKMEELYKKTLEKQKNPRFHCNLNPWCNEIAENGAITERKNVDLEGDKASEEHKSLVKLFENASSSRNSSNSSLHLSNTPVQQNKRLDTIFEKSNRLRHELRASGSSQLSLVDSMRSLNAINTKSARSKIETEFFQECQVNFETSSQISELLHAQEEIDCLQHKFHRLANALETPRRNVESFFGQAGKDQSALEKALRAQKDMIEDLQRNIKAVAKERLELLDRNEAQKDGKEENPKLSRTMVEGEMRQLNEQLFQKEYVINAQQKTMRSLEDKLESTYQELVEHAIKNKKLCCDCEGRLDDYRTAQKEILRLEEALKNSELQIEEERRENKSSFTLEKMKNENLLCALDEHEFESDQSLTPEEVQSQISVAMKRKQQNIDVLQSKIIQMASELESANKEITKCVEENRTLLEDYEVKLDQYRSAKDENDLLTSKIQQEKESLESVIRQKDERLKQLQQELMVREKEKPQKDDLVAELRESLNETVSNARNLKEIFESKLQEKDKRIEVLDHNFRQMTTELDNTNKERTQFVQEVQRIFCEYDVKLAVVNGECENAQKKILQLKQNENALNLLLTTAQAEAEKLKRAYEALSLHKQTMEEELRSEIIKDPQSGNEKRSLEQQIKSLRETEEQLDASNKGRLHLGKEMKKLRGELEAKTTTLKQRERHFETKTALLLKELEEAELQRGDYLKKSVRLFRKYENEIHQLNVDCRNMCNEIRCLKRGHQSQNVINLKNEAARLGEELELRDARLIRLEKDSQDQIRKLIFDYEKKLLLVNEENENLIRSAKQNVTVLHQKDDEIDNLQRRISEMEVELEAAEKEKVDLIIRQNGHGVSEASLFERASERSIPIIKEESALEAYEELITEKETLEGRLREMERELEGERRRKTEAENELERFRENERCANENLMRVLPEFLGQGDKTFPDGKTPERPPIDLRSRLNLLSKELEHAKAEKRELIRRGKQIFYHYETSIVKLKSDYERVQNEMLRIRSDGNCSVELRSLEIISSNTSKETQQLKESQEAYSKKLTCCLKELAIYKDDVKNWMETYDKVVKEKSDLETEMKILVNNVLHKDEIIKEVQGKLCDVQERFESATEVISDCESKYQKLNAEYEDAQNKLGELKRCKDEMNQKIITKDKVIRRYEERVDSERNENARLNERIGILKEKMSALEEDLRSKDVQLLDLTENYEKLKIEHDYLVKRKEDLAFYKMENVNLIREVEERDARIASLKKEIVELEKELRSVREEVELQNANASLNWEELRRTCAELEKKLELTKYALKKQECQAIIKADDEFKDLQKQIDALRDANDFLKEKLDCKDEEMLRLCERAQKEKTELNSHMVDTIRELEREIEEIKSNNRLLRDQITDRSNQLSQHKQHEVHKDNECEFLKRELHEAKAGTKKLREVLHGVEEKYTSLKTKNERLQADIAAMEKELLASKSWKTENAELQGKLDNIESELFIVKHQCAEVHEHLKTTKIKLAETQEELSTTKRDLESVRSSMSEVNQLSENKQRRVVQDAAGSTCVKTDLERENFCAQDGDKTKPNKNITVLYNNARYAESKCETADSTVSNVLLAKGSKIQERLASLNQMEKEVEEMISAVQQQNKKLKDCHLTRAKNEKDIDSRLQKVRQRRDTLETEFNTFQTETGHRIAQPVSVRRHFENS